MERIIEKEIEKKNGEFKHYPKTELFSVIGSLGIPHPYCITTNHVVYASKHYGGILNHNAIKDAEKDGALCGICKKGIDEHEKALVVNCNADDKEKLHEYLLLIKPLCIKEGFAGFVFKRGF